MKVILHGVRGSLPTPISPLEVRSKIYKAVKDFEWMMSQSTVDADTYLEALPKSYKEGFGGNTTCVEVQSEKQKILIDGGSGIRNTLPNLMKGPCNEGKGVVDIFLTHFHWDHILGLPFFVPLYIPGNVINFYAVQPELEEAIQYIFRKPYFPVPFEDLGSTINFIQLEPRKEFKLNDLKITPYQLDHPDPCWGFKISDGKKVYSHCVDNEGTRQTKRELGLDLPLYQGVDLMFFDAQYSYEEAKEKVNWGHSSAPVGLEIAVREGVKEIVFAHHDPMATDEDIAKIARYAVDYFETSVDLKKNTIPKWSIAQEGHVYDLLSK